MDLLNFGLEQLNNGSLDGMLEQAGVGDVGSFVNQFRNQAKSGGRGGNNSMDMVQGAMNAYQMFSGGKGHGSGGLSSNIGSTVQNAQQMYALYKQFDKNGDGRITAEDIQIYLQEIGLGGASPYLAQGLFQAVDQDHNGTLDFTDLMALTAMLNKLYGQYGQVPQ